MSNLETGGARYERAGVISIPWDKLPEIKNPPRAEDLVDLTQFASIRLYEEGKSELNQEEIKAAYDLDAEVVSWAKKII
jgi:hypothetical protein